MHNTGQTGGSRTRHDAGSVVAGTGNTVLVGVIDTGAITTTSTRGQHLRQPR
jgi:hypothetical protein